MIQGKSHDCIQQLQTEIVHLKEEAGRHKCFTDMVFRAERPTVLREKRRRGLYELLCLLTVLAPVTRLCVQVHPASAQPSQHQHSDAHPTWADRHTTPDCQHAALTNHIHIYSRICVMPSL